MDIQKAVDSGVLGLRTCTGYITFKLHVSVHTSDVLTSDVWFDVWVSLFSWHFPGK